MSFIINEDTRDGLSYVETSSILERVLFTTALFCRDVVAGLPHHGHQDFH